MSPALNGSSAIWCFERSDAIEIRDGITFYTGLPHMYCVHMQVSLTFVVYDWDGPLIGDDLLGVAKLNLTKVRPHPLYPG